MCLSLDKKQRQICRHEHAVAQLDSWTSDSTLFIEGSFLAIGRPTENLQRCLCKINLGSKSHKTILFVIGTTSSQSIDAYSLQCSQCMQELQQVSQHVNCLFSWGSAQTEQRRSSLVMKPAPKAWEIISATGSFTLKALTLVRWWSVKAVHVWDPTFPNPERRKSLPDPTRTQGGDAHFRKKSFFVLFPRTTYWK